MTDDFSDGLPRGLDVSRETRQRLKKYEALLLKWTPRINLIAPSTVPILRRRHFLDSAQLLDITPHTNIWADLGSGAGFPGAVVAILASELRPESRVVLVESDQRKATFLRTVSRETGVSFDVVCKRVEDIEPLNAGILSARALAPLPTLLEYAEHHLGDDGVAVFPKGEKADNEIAKAVECWRFDCEKHASINDANASVLVLRNIKRV